MSGVNKVFILGNVGRDPETSCTDSGTNIAKFSIATSRKKKDGTEITSWHRCVAFSKQAELIAQYVHKGDQIYIEGELSYGSYDKDGITHYTTDIIVQQMTFIGSKPSTQQQGFQNQNNQNQNNQNKDGYQRY